METHRYLNGQPIEDRLPRPVDQTLFADTVRTVRSRLVRRPEMRTSPTVGKTGERNH